MDRDGDVALAEFVRAERVRFVFIQSALPIFFSPLAAGILAAALWRSVGHTRLLVWAIGLLVIALVRVALVRAYPATNPDVPAVRAWERTFVASILLVDLWWGVGALVILPDAIAERAVVFCFVMLMAGGHASSYAAHPLTVLLGAVALAVPITAHFGLQPDTLSRVLAVASVMYLLATFRSIRTLEYFFDRTHRLAHALQAEKRRAEELARVDFMTRLHNRRAFYELGEAALRHAHRYGHPAALLMMDIDHFKGINDRHGHATGDQAIRGVADVIRATNRATDITGRLGGEEFALLLPETAAADAMKSAERLRERVAAHHIEGGVTITASVGVAATIPGETLEQLIARADRALYAAKHAGRNRVEAA